MDLGTFLKKTKAHAYLLGREWYATKGPRSYLTPENEAKEQVRLAGTIENLRAIRWYGETIWL